MPRRSSKTDTAEQNNCIFPGSSAVEQLAVNELVPGSNPGRGAFRGISCAGFFQRPIPE